MSEITSKERASFALGKVAGSTKWIVVSGTATYFFTGLLNVLAEIELPLWVSLIVYLIINTTIFGIGKYVEGQDK
jgi:hypothetical protein